MEGVISYDDAAKDAWRGWKWNTIAAMSCEQRSLPPSEMKRQLMDKTVLYLVGPDDHDRKRAMARGFRNENLIAVDVVQERVDEVRANGGLAICGTLQQVVVNWPEDWPIDVIDADLCSGLTKDVCLFGKFIHYSRAVRKRTVVSLNMMRGRDGYSNNIRRIMQNDSKVFRAVLKQTSGLIGVSDAIKHRGVEWVYTHLVVLQVFLDPQYDSNSYSLILSNLIAPTTNWYRSKTSGQYFDSVIHWLGYDSHQWAISNTVDWCRNELDKGMRYYDAKKNDLDNNARKTIEDWLSSRRGMLERIKQSSKEAREQARESISDTIGKVSTRHIYRNECIAQRIAALRAVRTKQLKSAHLK